jgi:hypothetical protein
MFTRESVRTERFRLHNRVIPQIPVPVCLKLFKVNWVVVEVNEGSEKDAFVICHGRIVYHPAKD